MAELIIQSIILQGYAFLQRDGGWGTASQHLRALFSVSPCSPVPFLSTRGVPFLVPKAVEHEKPR